MDYAAFAVHCLCIFLGGTNIASFFERWASNKEAAISYLLIGILVTVIGVNNLLGMIGS